MVSSVCFRTACDYFVLEIGLQNTTCDDDTSFVLFAEMATGECEAINSTHSAMVDCDGDDVSMTVYTNADCSGDGTDYLAALEAQAADDCLAYTSYCSGSDTDSDTDDSDPDTDGTSGAAQVAFKTALAAVMVATVWRV